MKPALVAGLREQGRPVVPGNQANLVVFDPTRQWTPTAFHSRSANSPWKGQLLQGMVKATLHKGELTHAGEVPR
jgi:dihydroorotase